MVIGSCLATKYPFRCISYLLMGVCMCACMRAGVQACMFLPLCALMCLGLLASNDDYSMK